MEHREKQVFDACAPLRRQEIQRRASWKLTNMRIHRRSGGGNCLQHSGADVAVVPNNGAIHNFDDEAMVEIPVWLGTTDQNHWWSAISRSFRRVNESASGGGKTGRGRLGTGSYQHLWQAITLSKTVPSASSPKLFWMNCWRPTKRTGQS